MQKLSEFPVVFPDSMVGKWRITFSGEFADEGGKKECFRSRMDLFQQ
jgi:hypothetical protein